MAYKRNINKLPIIPKGAKKHNVVCNYCIVGCGYHAYTWNVGADGTTTNNIFGENLSVQQGADSDAWYSPSMWNIVKQNGKDVNIVIKPDKNCVVNSGLGSPRGARQGELNYSQSTSTQLQRLTDPLVYRYGQLQPTSWDDAIGLVADVTKAVIDDQGEDGLFVSAFDHGGAGGGYENTWGTGKLYLESMKIKNIRIHNRPAYNSEVHGTRDMGVGELNYCYEDTELADTIVSVGANSLETQTNAYLNHWVPNMRGTSMDKKKKQLPGEDHAPARMIFVDPRRTVTINSAEAEAGKENVMHLAINSGTDLALFNAWMTYIDSKGWVDKDFIKASTMDYDKMVKGNKTSLSKAAKITGLTTKQIQQSAEWIAKPKGNKRRRTCFVYEKGLIWGNDNYRTNCSLTNVAAATGNIGRPGGGCCRMGGHQEGYFRPADGFIWEGNPAKPPYVDKLLIEGKGGVHHVWACDHYKTTLNAHEFKRVYKKRTDIVKDAMNEVPHGDRKALVKAIMGAIKKGGLFSVDVDIIKADIAEAAHVILPAATSGEMNLTSMNGERRMRLTERYMDPPGQALPDCIIASKLGEAMGFSGYGWKTEEDAFMDGYHNGTGKIVTYDRLRVMGNNGVQEPVIDYKDGKLVGVKRLYADGKFDRHGKDHKKLIFKESKWRGLQAPGKEAQKKKFKYLINNGRANHVWQSAYLDRKNQFATDRWPYPFIEMNPSDMKNIGVSEGDLVEVFNDDGSTQAMVCPTPTAKKKETFMLFAYPTGVVGNVVNDGVNEVIIPNYKQTWANIRKLANKPSGVNHVSFKSKEYKI